MVQLRHNWKIVDWDVKNQINQNVNAQLSSGAGSRKFKQRLYPHACFSRMAKVLVKKHGCVVHGRIDTERYKALRLCNSLLHKTLSARELKICHK